MAPPNALVVSEVIHFAAIKPGRADAPILSEFGPAPQYVSVIASAGEAIDSCRSRNITHHTSRRRGLPRVVAGSVHAGVSRCLGLARGFVVNRIPGVPPRSAAHPGLRTDGLSGRRSAATKPAMFRERSIICLPASPSETRYSQRARKNVP